jgi:hypothetical protein
MISPTRESYSTTHNTHKKQKSLLPVEFEPAVPKSERPQTHALDLTAIGIRNYNEMTQLRVRYNREAVFLIPFM